MTEIEEHSIIKLASGLAILRQRPDLVLPIKEQQILGRNAGVQRTRLSAVLSLRKKSNAFQLQMKMGLQKAKSGKVGGTILSQHCL